MLFPLFIAGALASVRVEKQIQVKPIRVVIAGLVHGHAGGFLRSALGRKEIEIVGIAEPQADVRERYAKQFQIPSKMFFTNVTDMLKAVRPEVALIYSSTYDHKHIAIECASNGVHVMMEKPLAVSLADAKDMQAAAKKFNVKMLVNYETTWYPNSALIEQIAMKGMELGKIRKVTVRDGHQGPVEIGCQTEFLQWLTNPKLNGAGALYDFGCYGANLMTWLMHNQRPISVYALTQQLKPDVYPKVDDDAIILLEYPNAQATLMASWNWPYGRKDWEIYGEKGWIVTTGPGDITVRKGNAPATTIVPPSLPKNVSDSISYLFAVIREGMPATGPSSLENNMIVSEILDAARTSAKTGRKVIFTIK